MEKKLEKGGGCERQRAPLLFPDRLMYANGWGESLQNIIFSVRQQQIFLYQQSSVVKFCLMLRVQACKMRANCLQNDEIDQNI